MSVRRFSLDTNILVYAVDTAAAKRHRIAVHVVEAALRVDCVVTLQALSEFYVTVVRKGKLPAAEARIQVENWQAMFPVVGTTPLTLDRAMRAVEQHQLSFWDAMLWAAARQAGVTTLLSEDMQHGRSLDGVEIVNPFLARSITKLFRS